MSTNQHIVLVVGKPGDGKTHSLRYIDDPKSLALFNCDRKATPYKNKFALDLDVQEPKDMLAYIDQCEDKDNIKTIVIDTITYLMRTFKVRHIDESSDSRASWGDYQKFYNKLMDKIKSGSKNYVVFAHIADVYSEENECTSSEVVLQGAIGKLGITGDYTTVVESISKPINKRLMRMQNDLMTITPQQENLGVKYLFLTRRMKGHFSSLARSASDLWEDDELYIDNDIQNVLNKLNEYYK
jgi:hypothetical protein